MGQGVRNIVVGTALVVAVAGIGWYATSSGDAQPASKQSRPAGARPGFGPGGPVNVLVATAGQESFAQTVEAIGTARANEAVDVTAKVSNRVTSIAFREGQQVKTGDVLVEFDSEQARANLAEAEAALRDSRSQFNRSRELYTTQVLSEAQLEQIEATLKANEARVAFARSRLSDTVITAPFAGRVGLRRVSVGSLINPGTVITTLDDASTIKLDFTIPETLLSSVKTGLGIVARSIAWPGEEFTGKVASVDSRVDPTTRSVTVRALLPNDRGMLKPGMFLTVKLTRGASNALLVPEQSLVPEQGNVFVYVVRDDRVEKRQVRTGERRVGEVQIVAGLAAGEQVVTEGTQKLRDGAPVKVQEEPAARASNAPDGART